jgi:chemotaxis signal transduction protein
MNASPKIDKKKQPAFLEGSKRHLKITKIVGMVPASNMACSREKIMGIFNFRGKPIPVLDLRMHLTCNPQLLSEMICIMKGQIPGNEGSIMFAALVDSEADAYELITSFTN